MEENKREVWTVTLNIVLGVVILVESTIVAVNYQSVSASSHIALPSQFVLILAVAEAIGAVLFMIPQTIKTGAIILLCVFLAAAVVAWFPFVLRAHALGFHPLATLVFFALSLTSALMRLRWFSVSRDVGIVEMQAQAA